MSDKDKSTRLRYHTSTPSILATVRRHLGTTESSAPRSGGATANTFPTTNSKGKKIGLTSPTERRPLINAQQQQQTTPVKSSAGGTGTGTGVRPNAGLFEIYHRDKSDATAKRAFRVQVPMRMIYWTCSIFIILPLTIFLWKEIHLHPIDNLDSRSPRGDGTIGGTRGGRNQFPAWMEENLILHNANTTSMNAENGTPQESENKDMTTNNSTTLEEPEPIDGSTSNQVEVSINDQQNLEGVLEAKTEHQQPNHDNVEISGNQGEVQPNVDGGSVQEPVDPDANGQEIGGGDNVPLAPP